jgi:septal ring factor EnvC (AmiA/AmiB activator)
MIILTITLLVYVGRALMTVDFPTIGGATGVLAAFGWALRELLGWLDRRKTAELTEESQHTVATSAAVADAATVNAVMLENIKALHTEIARLTTDKTDLQNRNAEKDAKIEVLQREVRDLRGQVQLLLQRLDGVDFELDDLRDKP